MLIIKICLYERYKVEIPILKNMTKQLKAKNNTILIIQKYLNLEKFKKQNLLYLYRRNKVEAFIPKIHLHKRHKLEISILKNKTNKLIAKNNVT